MGEEFMMKSSWRLTDEIAKQTQGMVATGFGRLDHGVALFLELPTLCGGKWLQDLCEAYPVTAASETGGEPLSCAVSLCFTASGLSNIGLSEKAMASFSAPFREGMMQEDRLRRLGDRRKAKWLDTVIDGGPIWSGNIENSDRLKLLVKSDVASEPVVTKKTVHAMITLYAKKQADVETRGQEIEKLLGSHKVKIVHRLPLALDVIDGRGFSREHFGFADGISQPIPFDEAGAVSKDGSVDKTGDSVHGVRLGEILLGHKNGHQEIAPGPVVESEGDSPIPEHDRAHGFRDLGKNGSYVVVRQLRQDVASFWNGMEQAAEAIRKQDNSATHVTGEWVAEKVVGRGIDGRGLLPDKRIENDQDNVIRNDFRFFDADRHGLGCPLGSHIRRANPRDSLAPDKSMKQTLLDAANNHRILRRGRKYGPKQEDRLTDDGEDRGLLFICLNTDIARQFEFTQQTWLLNSDFSTLFEETDPLVGPDGEMTIPAEPLRRRAKVQTFVKLVGGEYFFLPSMPGLKYLASL